MSGAIVRGVSWSFIAKGLKLVVSSASVILLARLLGAEEFGAMTWILSAAILLALVSVLGLPPATARLLAEDGRIPPRRILRVSVTLVAGLLAAAFLGVIALSDVIGGVLNAPFVAELGWVLALLMLVRVGERFCESAFEGLRRVDLFGKAAIRVGWLAPAAAVLAVVLVSPSARVALVAQALAGAFTVAVLGFMLFRHVRRSETRAVREPTHAPAGEADARTDHGVSGKLAGYSIPLFFVTLSFVIYTQSDILLIQWMLGVEAVGVYGAAVRIVESFALAGAAIGSGSAAFFPAARARGPEAYSKLFLQATRGVLLIYLPIAGGLLLTAGDVVPLLFGDEYAGAGLILAVYTPFIVCRGLSSVYSVSLDYLGLARFRAVAVSVSAAANIAVNLVLIPRFGILGAAVASQLTYVPLVCAYGFVLMRSSGTRAGSLFRAVRPSMSATAVMVVAVLIGRVMGAHLFLEIALGAATYIVLALWFGAVSRSELAAFMPHRGRTAKPTDGARSMVEEPL